MNRFIPFIFLLLTFFNQSVLSENTAAKEKVFEWESLPDLAPASVHGHQPGLAGAFSGVHNNALILAGGANFPDAPPWQGGKKVWWKDIYVLKLEDRKWITDRSFVLPRPLAYGASISTDDGVVCIGGCDAQKCFPDVFLIKWDAATGTLATETLPSLPRPLAFMAAARVGHTIYVAGGQETLQPGKPTKTFLSLDLSKKSDPSYYWQECLPWPGPERILPVVAAQSDGMADCLYLFSGRKPISGQATQLLTDGYKYNPKKNEWTVVADVFGGSEDENKGRCIMAAPCIAFSSAHILVFGGDDGDIFSKIENLQFQIARLRGANNKVLQSKYNQILQDHPGFSRDLLAYHTVTDTWTKLDELPFGSQVTTTAVRRGNSVIIPSGEIRPGVRTANIWMGTHRDTQSFGTLNYTVLTIYLLALLMMGFYFSKREKSTDDFFKAGRRIPWWAAGLSIFGTQLSAITFMAIPAKTFSTDWLYLWGNVAIIAVAPLVIHFFLPFYRRLDVTTAYEYLEKRFSLPVRLIASLMFMLVQLGRIGVILFLPSIALSVVTGIDVNLCIMVMGGLCIVYTVLGGIEAVIWTDVLQVIVLFLGAIFCLIFIPFHIQGGWNGMLELADAAGKFKNLDFRFDLVAATFWVTFIGGMGEKIISYGTDQTTIQRYLTTRDEKAARHSIWTGALLAMPATLIFFLIGSALFAFYKTHPNQLSATLENTDAIFPWFIVSQLPAGLSGLLIAGVFAAAMSSLDSSMNSVAASFTTDFYRRFKPDAAESFYLKLARWITAIVGTAGTLFALMMAQWDIKSLWDQFTTFIGLFGGGLGGLFILAIFTRRTNGVGAIVGLIGSGVIQFILTRTTTLHPWSYVLTGIISFMVLGYLFSLFLPIKQKSIAGLTIYDMKES
ncbi:sodium/solute symporter [candidate division KSB1 bacterium]|nr:sodium/solute symporter [candidate division KSB1 bacterium]